MSTIFDMELNDIEIDDGSSTMINTPNNRNIEIDYDVLSEDEPIEVDNEIEVGPINNLIFFCFYTNLYYLIIIYNTK